MMRVSRKTEVRYVAELTPQLTIEDNHDAVCTVLTWAARAPKRRIGAMRELYAALGLDLVGALIEARARTGTTR